MFKSIWNSLQGERGERNGSPLVDRAKLKLLVDHFPIGKKPRYYPEYQEGISFHTIILAYRVNDRYLYSRDSIVLDDEGVPTGFLLRQGKVLPWQELERFQLLLPDTSEMEKKLDYFTRAELGRAGQFGRGNTITLVAESVGRGIPTMDTRVERRQVMQDGPFADSSTILITPDLGSLVLADKRRKLRVQADAEADLFIGPSSPPVRCVLGDFSEVALRLCRADGGGAMPMLEADDQVVVEFSAGEYQTVYRLRGKVFRRADDYCVINLERIFKDGEFERLKMMDVMEIKTGLLNRNA